LDDDTPAGEVSRGYVESLKAFSRKPLTTLWDNSLGQLSLDEDEDDRRSIVSFFDPFHS